MAKRGGKREGAGRKPGTPNKTTAQARMKLSALALDYSEDAIKTLAHVALNSPSDSARVSAATAILDRAYGKPQQSMELGGPDGGPVQTQDVSDLELARWIAFQLSKADKRLKEDS